MNRHPRYEPFPLYAWRDTVGRVGPIYPRGEMQIGQEPPLAPPSGPDERFTLPDLGNAVRKITPTLLVVGIATGIAFAIGSGLVRRYVFED